MEKELIHALQLQITSLIGILAEKKIIELDDYLEHCRALIAEAQQSNPDVDWGHVRAMIDQWDQQ